MAIPETTPMPPEVEALEERIGKMEFELQEHYSLIGKSLLELADTEQKAVNRLIDEIIEARTHLARAQEQTTCGWCGAYNDADGSYCKRCGQKL